MRHARFVWIILALGSVSSAHDRFAADSVRAEIRAVIFRQVQGWNDGSLEAFMEGYERSDSLRFASGGSITYGWQTMLERYRRSYSSREKMGKLEFTGISIDIISPDAAVVFGTWTLVRSTDAPGGLFTLLLKRTNRGWKIVHDHTSSAAEK